jgi:hypothetical protein
MLSSREPTEKMYGNIDAGSTILASVGPNQIGYWLTHAMGVCTSSGSSAPYTHTFTPKTLPSFIIEHDYSADIASTVVRLTGCRVSSATLQIAQEGPVTISLESAAGMIVKASSPLDATPTEPGHDPWGTEHVGITIDGVSACGIKSFSLTIDNELDTSIYTLPCTGETYGQRGELPEGRCAISGSMDLMFSTAAAGLLTSALAKSSVAIVVTMQHGAGTGATVGNEKLTLTLPKCHVGLFAPPITTRSGISVSVPFTAWKDSSSALTAVLLSPLTAADMFISS